MVNAIKCLLKSSIKTAATFFHVDSFVQVASEKNPQQFRRMTEWNKINVSQPWPFFFLKLNVN